MENSLGRNSTTDSLLWNALPDLQLNIAQTASLCGISVRQLGYWTKQGYVKAVGQGARRLYGLEALRAVLTIRHAMQNGASLRQSVRAAQADSSLSDWSLEVLPAQSLGAASPPVRVPIEAVITDLRALIEANRYTRDSAAGLANKLGRAEDDVRRVAEMLCAEGWLSKVLAPGEPIFQRRTEVIA